MSDKARGPRRETGATRFSVETTGADSLETNLTPQADFTKVLEFLVNFGGPWHLSRSGKGFPTRSFDNAEQAATMACDANNRGHCVYYMGNQPNRSLRRRARQSDIRECVGSWIDIDDTDPEIARELLNRLDWAPTYVAFTGGGWQAFWRYDAPTTDKESARAVSAWLQSEFEDLSPDRTHSVEHLFRLPGTCNRKQGRDNRLCEVYAQNWNAVLPLADAGRVEPGIPTSPIAVDLPATLAETDMLHLCELLPPWAFAMLKKRPEHLPSRSEHEWSFIAACIRDLGSGPEVIEAVTQCLLLPAAIGEEHKVGHRTQWAKLKGRYVPRRNPMAHVARQIGSFLAKEAANV